LEPFPKLFEAFAICSLMELYMGYLGAGHEMVRADRIRYVESMDPKLSRPKKLSRVKVRLFTSNLLVSRKLIAHLGCMVLRFP
jgi:hypothetical protein